MPQGDFLDDNDDSDQYQGYTIYRGGKPIRLRAPKGTDPNVILRDVQHQVDPQNYPKFTPQQQEYPGVGSVGANIMQGGMTGAVDPVSEAARMLGVEPNAMRNWVESQRKIAGSTYSGRTGEFIGSQWPYAALEFATGGTATPEIAAAEAAKAGEVAGEAGEAAAGAAKPLTEAEVEAQRAAREYNMRGVFKGREAVSMPPGWTFRPTTLADLTESQKAAQATSGLIPRSARAGRIGAKAVGKAVEQAANENRAGAAGEAAVADALRTRRPIPMGELKTGARSVPAEAPRTIQQPGTVMKRVGGHVAQIIAAHPHIAGDIAAGAAATGAPTDPNDPRYYGQKAAQFVSGVLAREGLRISAIPGESLGHLIDRIPHALVRRVAQLVSNPVTATSGRLGAVRGLSGSVAAGTGAGQLESIVGPWYTESMKAQQPFSYSP